MNDIITTIHQITGQDKADKVSVIEATVDSVDENARTCTVTTLSNGAEVQLPDVRLMAEISDGILVIPAVGSTVFVTYSRFTSPFVSLFSDVSKVVILGGEHGGLVQVVELVNKLNNIEKMVNDLASKYNSHTHILTLSSGTGTAAATTSAETTTLTQTQRGDIENTSITHGSA